MALACGAFAQHGDDQWAGALVERLDADDVAQRREAEDRLRTRLRLSDLERMLNSNERLSPEQRLRLETLAWDMFRNGQRAGMGIQFAEEVSYPVPGVRIGATVPGFDAARVLKADDLIVAIGGEPIRERDQVRAEILSRAPGEPMALTVQRGEQRIDTSVVMGAYADLQQAASLNDDVLDDAWDRRRERIGMAVPPTITIDAASGSIHVDTRLRGTGRLGLSFERFQAWLLSSEPTVTVAGESRGGLDQTGRVRTAVAGFDVSLPPVPALSDYLDPEDELTLLSIHQADLDAQRQQLQVLSSRLQVEVSSPSMPEDQRQAILRMQDRIRRAMIATDDQRRRAIEAGERLIDVK
ncbi:MAG: PDZ domain-containing protein [Phycisphaeraceae bacterium]|nr:PDZ domain-containing protein [Phycisphaeraceae bacterium]